MNGRLCVPLPTALSNMFNDDLCSFSFNVYYFLHNLLRFQLIIICIRREDL